MYEERFGTDWETLSGREEAIRRAFALGVAARVGEHYPEELDRISDAVDTSYDRSFVELAYHEGRDTAAELDPDPEADPEDLWERVLEEDPRLGSDRPDRPETETPEGIPDAVGQVNIDSRPEDSRGPVSRPQFLRREEAQESGGRRRRRRERAGRGEEAAEDDVGPTEEERQEFESLLEPDDDGEDAAGSDEGE